MLISIQTARALSSKVACGSSSGEGALVVARADAAAALAALESTTSRRPEARPPPYDHPASPCLPGVCPPTGAMPTRRKCQNTALTIRKQIRPGAAS